MADNKWDKYQVDPAPTQTTQTPSQDKWSQFQVDPNKSAPEAATPTPSKEGPGFWQNTWDYMTNNPMSYFHGPATWAKNFFGTFGAEPDKKEIDKQAEDFKKPQEEGTQDYSLDGIKKTSENLYNGIQNFVAKTSDTRQDTLKTHLLDPQALVHPETNLAFDIRSNDDVTKELLNNLKFGLQPSTYIDPSTKKVAENDIQNLTYQPLKITPDQVPQALKDLDQISSTIKSQYDTQKAFITSKYDNQDKAAQSNADNYGTSLFGVGEYHTPKSILAGRVDDQKDLDASYQKVKDLLREQRTRVQNSLDAPYFNPLSQLDLRNPDSLKASGEVFKASSDYFKTLAAQSPADIKSGAAINGVDNYYVDEPYKREITKLAMKTKPEVESGVNVFRYEPWNEQYFAYSELKQQQGRVQNQIKQDQTYLDGLTKTFKDSMAADGKNGKPLTDSQKEQINDIGSFIKSYTENIAAKNNYLSTLNTTLTTQTKDFAKYLTTQQKLNNLYDESLPLSVTTAQFLKYLNWQLPRNVDNWAEAVKFKFGMSDLLLTDSTGKPQLVQHPDKQQKELAYQALYSDKISELEPQKLSYNPNWNVGDPIEQAKIRQNLSQLGSVQVFDNKGNFSPQFDLTGIYYQSLKTTAESVVLGTAGGLAEEAITKNLLQSNLASRLGVNIVERELGASITDEAMKDYLLKRGVSKDALSLDMVKGSTLMDKAAYNALETANWGAVTTIGMGVPSMAMFGSYMAKNELTKGDLTGDESTNIGNVRAFWEGLTERVGFDEIQLVRHLMATGEIRTLAQLGESEIYQNAIARTIEKTTGRSFSPKVVAALFGVEVLAKEGGEEVASDFLNHLTDVYESHKHGGQYREDNQFDMANETNTMLSTMATMLFTGFEEGMHKYHEINNREAPMPHQLAQYIVAQNPGIYLNAINGQLNSVDATKQIPLHEAARRIELVNKYKAVYDGMNTADIDAKPISDSEKEAQKFIRFQNSLKTIDLGGALILAGDNEAKKTVVLNQLENMKEPAPENPNIYPLMKALQQDRGEWLKAQQVAEQKKTEQATPEAAVQNNNKGMIPITHADGSETSLAVGQQYHVSSFSYRSAQGDLLKFTPVIRIIADEGNGSVSIASGGEVSSIPKDELAKYKFLPKETVDEWRKAGDVRALLMDNYNKVFSYTFANGTKERDQVPQGRVRWDPKQEKAFFIYKDKAGKERQQELTAEDFKLKLKLVKSLTAVETQADFEQRQRDYQEQVLKTHLGKLDAQKALRTQVFDAFIAQEAKKVTKIYDKAIKQLVKGIADSKQLVKTLTELRKKAIMDINDLINSVPREMVFDMAIAKGFAVVDGKIQDSFANVNAKFSRYDILTAINQHLKAIQANNIDPVEAQIKGLEEQRQQALDNLGLDYDEIANADYETDRTITEQVKEYRNAMKERLKETTSLLGKLKEFAAMAREMITSLSNKLIDVIPHFANVAYDPMAEETEAPTNIKEDLDELEKEYGTAAEKIKKLEAEAEGLPAEIEKLNKVVRFLTREEKKYREAKEKISLEKAKESIFKSQYSSQTNSETNPPTEDEVAADKAMADAAKIEIRKLFNSTTSSSPVAADGTLTDEPVARLQHFLNNVADPEAHSVILITKDNAEQFGLQDIIFTGAGITNKTDKEDDNDIRLVVVRNNGDNEFDFVDKDGKKIGNKEVTPENVVYTAMRLAKLNWSDGDVNYVVKGAGGMEVQAFAEALRANHADLRQQAINLTKAGQLLKLPVTGVSRGHINLQGAPTSVVNNLIPASVDLATTQVIQIPTRTAQNTITGQVVFTGLHTLVPMPTGRPVLSFGQNLAFLNNKSFTKNDIDKLVKVFVALYNEAKKTGELNKDIVKYLSKVLYWRNPTKLSEKTDKPQEGETIGRGQIWFNRKDATLHFGNQDQKMAFSFEGDDQSNFTMLKAFLSGVHHNVDAQDIVGVPFSEIVDVTKTGKVVTIEWPSYQAYLLSNSYPDGTARQAEDTPLTTVIQPSKEGIPNIKGRYLTYENKSNDDAVSTAGYTITTVPGDNGEQQINPKLGSETSAKNTTGWTKAPTNDFTKLERSPDKEYEIRAVADDGSVQTMAFTFGKNGGSFITSHNILNQFGKPRAPQEIKPALDSLLSGTTKNNRATIFVRDRVESTTGGFVAKGDVTATDTQAKNLPFTPLVKAVQQPGGFVAATTNTNFVPASGEKPTTTGLNKKAFLDALKKKAGDTAKDDTNYRLATKRSYALENLQEAQRWFKDRFPSIDFHVVVGLIDGKAWGVVRDGALTLSNLAETGTVLHEAFEVVHKYFMNNTQLRGIRNEFRSRKGTFVEYGTGNKIEYSKATNFQIKEQLAEEYREYGLSDGQVFFQGEKETRSFFKRIYDFIHDFVIGKPDTIKEVFDKIQDAKYRDQVPDLQTNNLNSEYKIDQIKQEHVTFFHDAMRSMTNLMFENLRKQSVSIPEFLLTDYDTASVYDDVKDKMDAFYGGTGVAEMIKTYTQEAFIKDFSDAASYNSLLDSVSPALVKGLSKFVTQNGLVADEALSKLYDVFKNYGFIHDNWGDFVAEHKLYLGKYQIEFSEDGDVKETDEENENYAEYARDVLKISRKLNANTEIKLLIATLRELEIPPAQVDKFGFKTGTVDPSPKLNSLLMSQLVDYNKTIVTLLYKMAPTTSFDEVATTLKGMIDTNPSLAPLVEKLKLNTPALELSKFDVDLRNKFYTSLSNMLAEYHKLLLNPEDLTGGIVNLNEQRAIGLVKEKWLSALKLNTKLVRIEKGLYKIKTDALPVKSIADERDALKFLNSIGIDFPNQLARLTKDQRSTFLTSARDLLKTLYSTDPDAILSDNATTRQPLTALAELYVDQTDSYAEPQHLNVEGEAVQNILLHNSIGLVIKNFNASKTLDDFFKRIPQLSPTAPGNGFLKNSQVLKAGGLFFDSEGNKRRSISIDLMDGSQVRDTEAGTPTSNLNFVDRVAQEFANNLSGLYHTLVPGDTKSEWGFGFGQFVTRQQAQNDDYILPIFKDYLRAEISAVQDFLNGVTSNDVHLNNHSDGIKVGAQLRFFKGILKSLDANFNLHINKDQSVDEIIQNNEAYIDKAILAYIQGDVSKTVDFFHKEGIIIPYKERVDHTPSGNGFVASGTPTGFVPNGGAAELPESSGKFSIAFAPKEFTKDGLTEDEVHDLVKFANLNYIMGLIEQHKMIWGDPGMWKDMPKRTKSFTSGRMLSVANAQYFNEWHNRNSNTLNFVNAEGNIQSINLNDGEFGHWTYDDNIRTQTMRDVLVVSKEFEAIKTAFENNTAQDLYEKNYSELDEEEKKEVNKHLVTKESGAYENINEADAQSWAPFPGYREIRQRANTWKDAEEEVFQWDSALARWEITNNKDYVTGKPVGIQENLYPEGPKGDMMREHDEKLLAKGNPYLLRAKAKQELPILNILKPIQAGPKIADHLINNLDKTSTMPVTWRIAKGTALASWYLTHVKAGTTYVKVISANKVGGTTSMQSMYDEDGAPNLNVNHEQLSYRGYGIQVETITQKDKSTLGTQMTKQATMNLIGGGIPANFTKANASLSKGALLHKWDNLPLEDKLKNTNYKLAYNNNLLLATLKELAKREVFKEFGITDKTGANGQKVFEFTNLDKFERLIQRELNLRNAPENVKEFAKVQTAVDPETGAISKKFALPFDLIIGSEKLESLLTSVIDKEILRPKMNGGQFPQVSSTMFEKNKRNLVHKNADGNWVKVDDYTKLTAEQKKGVMFTSNDLKFYKAGKDGKTEACEIMVPFFFKEFIAQGKELSISDIPAELLEGVGFRIPTQGVNAMEFFKIKGFLPVEYGNSVVVPSEITAKSGSDFDIDKLNIYLHNYDYVEGKLVKTKFLDDSNSTVEERYNAIYGKKYLYDRLNTRKGIADFRKAATFALAGNLMETIFDTELEDKESILDYTKSYEDNLEIAKRDMEEKISELPTIAQFSKLPVEMQNTKEAVENQYIDNIKDILSLPENFAQLVEPNSAKVLKDEATKINRMYQKESSAKSFTNFIDRLKNADTRHSFLVGKGGVGIGAASQSQHAVAQLVGLPFTESFDVEAERSFNFPTNHEISEDGKTITYHLAETHSQDKRTISSVISAFISALVDVNKDPFIIDINGNLGTLGAYLTAVRMGIPINLVVRWFNQPVIRAYIKAMEKEKSILSQATNGGQLTPKSIIVANVLSQFRAVTTQGFTNQQGQIETKIRTDEYTEHELDNYIKHYVEQQKSDNPKYTQEFADAQAGLMKEFLALEALQWQMFAFGQALVDTTRNVTLDGIRLKNAKVVKALRGPFRDSVMRVFRQTFQGNILLAKQEFLQSLRPLYITETPMARSVLSPILNQLFNSRLKNDTKEKEAKDMRRAFITYLIHTIPISVGGEKEALLTDFIKELFLGKNNMTRQVRSAQEAQQKGGGTENFFLKNLLATASDKANIKLLRKSSDKIDQDLMTSDFLNLRNDPNGLANTLIKAAMLQSGVRITPTSFQELIPNELFAEISNQVLAHLQNPANDVAKLISNFSNSYYENSWRNRNIVPKAEIYSKFVNPETGKRTYRMEDEKDEEEKWLPFSGINMLQFYIDSSRPKSIGTRIPNQAKVKYLLVQRLAKDEVGNTLYTKREMEEMKRRGDWSFLEQTLYKRLEVMNEDGQMDAPIARRNYMDKVDGKWVPTELRYVLFYPVNKKGDGINAVEHYDRPHQSAFYPAVQRGTDQEIYQGLQAQANGKSQYNSMTNLFLGQHYLPQSGESDYSLSLQLLTDAEESNSDVMDDDILTPALRRVMLFDSGEEEKKEPVKTEKTEEDPFPC